MTFFVFLLSFFFFFFFLSSETTSTISLTRLIEASVLLCNLVLPVDVFLLNLVFIVGLAFTR